MTHVPGEATRLLVKLGQGNEHAAAELLPLVYDELRALAQRQLRQERPDHTLQPTALVHEAYLRLIGGSEVQPEDRNHFFALAAQAIRRVLVDHARARGRCKRGGGRARVPLEEIAPPMAPPDTDLDLLALDEALSRLAEVHPRCARVVELRYFGGCTKEEVAQLLDVSSGTVERDWRIARGWLFRALSSDESRLAGEVDDG
jgi:RNA polymerase sigma factor (TIGR02999 family)